MMIHDWNVRRTSLLIFERTQGFARFWPVTPNSEIGQFHAQQPSCRYTASEIMDILREADKEAKDSIIQEFFMKEDF